MIVQKRFALHDAIRTLRYTQREVAYMTGMGEGRLSGIVNGWVDPRPEERQKLASFLGRNAKELFPELRARGK